MLLHRNLLGIMSHDLYIDCLEVKVLCFYDSKNTLHHVNTKYTSIYLHVQFAGVAAVSINTGLATLGAISPPRLGGLVRKSVDADEDFFFASLK